MTDWRAEAQEWRGHARRWEERCKANAAEVARLKDELALLAARERGWREAMSALNTGLVEQMERVAKALDGWEATE